MSLRETSGADVHFEKLPWKIAVRALARSRALLLWAASMQCMRWGEGTGLLLVFVALTGCGGGAGGGREAAPSGDAPASTDSFSVSAADSEAERTRALEAQAAEMERGFAEAQAAGATGEEAVDAYQEFERQRAELNRAANEQGIAPAETAVDEEAAPPPP